MTGASPVSPLRLLRRVVMKWVENNDAIFLNSVPVRWETARKAVSKGNF